MQVNWHLKKVLQGTGKGLTDEPPNSVYIHWNYLHHLFSNTIYLSLLVHYSVLSKTVTICTQTWDIGDKFKVDVASQPQQSCTCHQIRLSGCFTSTLKTSARTGRKEITYMCVLWFGLQTTGANFRQPTPLSELFSHETVTGLLGSLWWKIPKYAHLSCRCTTFQSEIMYFLCHDIHWTSIMSIWKSDLWTYSE